MRKAICLTGMVGLLLIPSFVMKGEIADGELLAEKSDNFYEAKGRLWVPESGSVDGTLVILGGTDSDGRHFAGNESWQRFAQTNHLALFGFYFRGDGESYDDAAHGSGQALLKVLEQCSAREGRHSLSQKPLLLVGHSAGAMFAFNFAAWRPAQTVAVVSIKTGPIPANKATLPQSTPILFILGETEVPSRLLGALDVFQLGREVLAPWALAVEPRVGHGWTPADTELARAYLADALKNRLQASTGASQEAGRSASLRRPRQENLSKEDPRDVVCLPGEESAVAWRNFTKATRVADLWATARRPEESPPNIRPTSIDLGVGLADQLSKPQEVVIDCVEAREMAFAVEAPVHISAAAKAGKGQYRVTLWLDAEKLSAGIFRSSISATVFSTSAKMEVPISIMARVENSLVARPASFYLGVIPRGEKIQKSINLTLKGGGMVEIDQIRSSVPLFATVQIKTGANGCVLVASFDGEKALGNQSGYFELRRKGTMERIRIPFVAWVMKGA